VVVTAALVPEAPGDTAFERYARQLASEFGAVGKAPLLDVVQDRLDWIEVRIEPLAAPEGRQDALLCPRLSHGFVLVLDPRLSPADAKEGRDLTAALDRRVAHELGHTYFFTGRPPRRWSRWSPAEEEHADRIGELLLRALGRWMS
jgi:hypothetical protein